jgi:arylsulfatase A-like enzyme
VHRIDGCFGAFVDDLKRRGLYDSSIVVVTADHGDSLGEAGRWGHAYTVFPEILRVPFIARLPKPLLEGRWT